MKMHTHTQPILATLVCIAMPGTVVTAALAGDLEPPGPPEPTMKTLVDVEPRIPIHAEDLPLTITEPGSYYLAEDINTSGEGILVSADDVTIDLMGHALSGGVGTGIDAQSTRVTVKNGIVHSWSSHGVYLGAEALVSRVRSSSNGGMGIRVSVVSSVFESFSAYNGNDGIWIESGHVRDCYVSANEGNGIVARVESSIIDCDARLNTLNGIRVSIDTTMRGNHCSQNGETVQKSGILVLGTGNRIDGNTVYSNGAYGIRVEDSGKTIHRNAASLNGNDYWFVTGNDVGPVGPSSTATSPWANLSF